MEHPYCDQHMLNTEKLAVIANELTHIRAILTEDRETTKEHIHEGEKAGGVRDQVRDLQKAVGELKRAEWSRVGLAGIIGGVMGALLGAGCTDAIRAIALWLIK